MKPNKTIYVIHLDSLLFLLIICGLVGYLFYQYAPEGYKWLSIAWGIGLVYIWPTIVKPIIEKVEEINED